MAKENKTSGNVEQPIQYTQATKMNMSLAPQGAARTIATIGVTMPAGMAVTTASIFAYLTQAIFQVMLVGMTSEGKTVPEYTKMFNSFLDEKIGDNVIDLGQNAFSVPFDQFRDSLLQLTGHEGMDMNHDVVAKIRAAQSLSELVGSDNVHALDQQNIWEASRLEQQEKASREPQGRGH